MTDLHSHRGANQPASDACCGSSCAVAAAAKPDERWRRDTRRALGLAWLSLVWMVAEGAVGLWQGFEAGSVALIGWALGSAVEGLASTIVVWRFTGARRLSPMAERSAQRAVAVSFWLLAPYVAVEAVRDLLGEHRIQATAVGMASTAASVLAMPLLGRAKHRLGERLGSGAVAGEGTQNYLCAAQAAAVLVGLAVTAVWSGGWWLDPVVGLGVAAAAIWQGRRSWRGEDCC